MKKQILFVDDEPHVLTGLRRMLHAMRREWAMEFAESGQAALETLSQKPFDVLVTDMRMPGMDGAELLQQVSEKYPQVVRIVLSGQANKETVLKSVGPTHQYLSKPCDPDELKATIARTFRLRDLLSDSRLKLVLTKIKTLPSLPTLYLELMQELRSPDVTMTKVGEIISKDVAMTAKILQLVNSAFFGVKVHVSSPVHAAKLLGGEILRSLVLSAEIFSKFENSNLGDLSLQKLMDHSLTVSSLSKEIAVIEGLDKHGEDNTLLAGMLHDAGKLILAENLPEEFAKACTLASQNGQSQYDAEKEVFGATHAAVGAYLLGLWGLPEDIIEAVAFHHQPMESLDKELAPLTAVHVANAWEHQSHDDGVSSSESSLDPEYIENLGLTERVEVWREKLGTTLAQSDY